MRAYTLLFFAFASQLVHFGSAYAKYDRRYSPHSTTITPIVPGDPQVDIIASRQHHERRALLDVCASIDTSTILSGDVLGIPLSDIIDLDLCLCLSAFPLILEVDLQLKALSDTWGAALVQAALTLLINTAPSCEHCTYPAHSQQTCVAGDPCGFTCDSPYVKQGNECVCALPYSMCNGICGEYPKGCGSAVPRALVGRADRRSHNRLKGAAAQASCKNSETVCGILDGDENAYDCVDTDNDRESCGGCVTPSPFLEYNVTSHVGRNCAAIGGVNTVSCISGTCSVTSCKEGWTVADTGDTCVEVQDRSGLVVRVPEKMRPDPKGNESELIARTPEKMRPDPKVKESELEGPDQEKETHAGYYNSAWYAL